VGVPTPDEFLATEAWDPDGRRVVVPIATWHGKVLRDHPELAPFLAEVIRAISKPDHIEPDPDRKDRRHHFLREIGPSRWLLVVIGYEQVPARLVTAFPKRKGPSSWSG
jgi:hypothetical protein